MILTDYLTSNKTIIWDFAKQCGVENGVIRLPEDKDFDITNFEHWKTVHNNFMDFGIKPIMIEPMPNCLHDHIKAGDELRDRCIEKVIKSLEYMDKLDIRGICFNFMAHVGWTRTDKHILERGDAYVTGFNLENYIPTDAIITKEQLWDNYRYFIDAVVPYAEKYNVNLALHPDDPPLERLGNVERIMISADNIEKAMNIHKSKNLGITMCQATYKVMGEDLYEVIPRFKDKIMFVHFRNVKGTKTNFRETFHDNGDIEMGKLLKFYNQCGINVPIRVDHVPTMAGENVENAGYDALGRLYSIGYLKGLIEGCE